MLSLTKPRFALRQGDLDFLCGLYSAINAVQQTIFTQSRFHPNEATLFAAGVKQLSERCAFPCVLSISTSIGGPPSAASASSTARHTPFAA